MGERVAESECNTPCQDGADGTPSGNGTPQPNGFSGDTVMCGGPWRNSVYQQSTTNWEKAGYNDGGWQAAADLGPNGIAPWFHRQGIADTARWIWTAVPFVCVADWVSAAAAGRKAAAVSAWLRCSA